MSALSGFKSGGGIVRDRWEIATGVTPAGYVWTVETDGTGGRTGLQILMGSADNRGHYAYAGTVGEALRKIGQHV